MRNQEAARYARWAAIAAVVVALSVAGVYAQREIRVARARRHAPPMLPSAVQQQSANFVLSDSDAQGRTTFTIRASHATQFKEENRAVLQDVWITIYGRQGNGNDEIRTRECSYQPVTGNVLCDGDVQIEIKGVNANPDKPDGGALKVNTSHLSFNKNTGEASTPAPVEFEFSGGKGHGIGIAYRSKDSIVRVEHEIEFEMAASDRTGGFPVTANGSGLTVRRNDRVVVLDGPAVVTEGDRQLSAGRISIELDESYHAQHVLVEGHPEVHAAEGKGKFTVAAEKFEGIINAAGWVQRVVADGNVAGTRQTSAGADRFNARHAEFAMLPEHNLLKDMTATGSVTGASQQGKDSRTLKTDALRVTFAPNTGGAGSRSSADKQRIETVESLAPATVQSTVPTTAGDEATELSAQRVVAQFGEDGHLGKLLAHSGVQVRRQTGKDAPQTSSASELAATFGKGGDWDTLDETGNVRFEQADRRANAAHAKISRAADTISLEGAPEFSDSISHTTAGSVAIDQKSGEIHAGGGVVSTYLPTQPGTQTAMGQATQVGKQPTTQGNTAINFGTGSAHISADTLSGSSSSGNVTYSGHARLWQGDSVLEADQIEVWRDDKKLQATGHVVAQFQQTAGPIDQPFGKQLATSAKPQSGPVLWTVRSPSLTYWDDQGKAHLEGGVSASSQQGSLTSKSLDVYLSAPSSDSRPGTPVRKPTNPPGNTPTAPEGRQLDRVFAQGSVVVRQGDRRGMAEQAEYTAADEKFVLSGGQPTLIDNATSDTMTGRSLTFYVANDTILIDSQEGSRTLTKHRIEK